MDRRTIGTLDVSVVGLGCNNFGGRLDAAATERVVHAALDAGVNFFDTAESYGNRLSEEYLGRALGTRRGEAVIATKYGWTAEPDASLGDPATVRRAAENSLRRLKTDVIDLYQLHRPNSAVPIADTLGALHDLVEEGLVREIGCSNLGVDALSEAAAAASGRSRFVSVQNHYSLLQREPEEGVLQACEALDMAFLPYFPLANGLLTGKYRKGQPAPKGTRITGSDREEKLLTEQNLDRVESLLAFAEDRGHTLLELAFAWLLKRPTVASVIAGATSVEQVRANAAASTWHLNDAEMRAIDDLSPGGSS